MPPQILRNGVGTRTASALSTARYGPLRICCRAKAWLHTSHGQYIRSQTGLVALRIAGRGTYVFAKAERAEAVRSLACENGKNFESSMTLRRPVFLSRRRWLDVQLQVACYGGSQDDNVVCAWSCTPSQTITWDGTQNVGLGIIIELLQVLKAPKDTEGLSLTCSLVCERPQMCP